MNKLIPEVIDRGEWTDKKMESGKESQTSIIPCNNIIFIMTTNSATDLICNHVKQSKSLYTGDGNPGHLEEQQGALESLIRQKLQKTNPFTDAFIGRVDRIVPFLPLARGGPADKPLLDESMTVAKIFIEREQDRMKDDTIAKFHSL